MDLLRKDHVNPNLWPPIRVCNSLRLSRVTEQMVEGVGTVFLLKRTRERLMYVMTSIVRNVSVPVSTRTIVIDKFTKGISPSKRKIVSINPPCVTKLAVNKAEADIIGEKGNTTSTW